MGAVPTNRRSATTFANRGRPAARIVVAGLLAASVGLLASAGVYAGLAARSTAAAGATSGALDLTLSPDVGTGFHSFAGRMAPGDTDNVFVDLDNTGSLASAAGMMLQVTGVPSNALVDGAVAGEGLTVAAVRCSVAWKLPAGTCAGTITSMLSTTPVSAVPAAGAALSNVPALAASTGRVAHVRVTVGLVATETSVNGAPPATTVQGLATVLGFTFAERQRTGTATDR